MPSPSRFGQVLRDRRLPRRTRIGLVAAEARRRVRPKPVYTLRYGRGQLFLAQSDYAIDWETLKSVLVDEPYPTGYRGAVVLDLGAHKGYYGAYALEHGAQTVISYEPETANLELLERSAASFRARGANWQVRRSAVGAEQGEADLHVMGASWGHALHPPADWSEFEVGMQLVPVAALTDVLAEAASHTDASSRLVVKINIEGDECEMVLGTPQAAWLAVSELFVETHPWTSCGGEELAAHLAPAGLRQVERAHERMLQLRR
jgi:FkbM family methyltransferase